MIVFHGVPKLDAMKQITHSFFVKVATFVTVHMNTCIFAIPDNLIQPQVRTADQLNWVSLDKNFKSDLNITDVNKK